MKYRLKNTRRFRCGNTVFGFPTGGIVTVKQRDNNCHKVLIDFGHGDIDWFHKDTLEDFEAIE